LNDKKFNTLLPDNSVDIAKMVGLLDYLSEADALDIITQVYHILKNDGLFILASVSPNPEAPLLAKIGWPSLSYRKPEEVVRILQESGFARAPVIAREPLKVHMIATVRK
jgi:hypothetical protein